MRKFFQKFIISIIGLSIILNPLVVLVPQNFAKAATNPNIGTQEVTATADGITGSDPIDLSEIVNPTTASDADSNYTPIELSFLMGTAYSAAFGRLLANYYKYSPSGASSNLSFADLFIDPNNPAIVMNQADRDAVNKLMCMTAVLPDYAADYNKLFADLPPTTTDKEPNPEDPQHPRYLDQKSVNEAVDKEKNQPPSRYTTYYQYFNFLQYGTDKQDPTEHISNIDYWNALVKEAGKSRTNDKLQAVWNDAANKIASGQDSGIAGDTLACVTGLSVSVLRGRLRKMSSPDELNYVAKLVRDSTTALSIDIRVINTLIYLVTPKDQGGGGHWRIRVARLLQSDEESRESDATIEANNKTAAPTLTAASANNAPTQINCDSSMTAAECGSQQTANSGSAVVEDKDGTEYDAFFQNMDKEMGDERNVSAHKTGQAIDISEVDDLRCTLVQKHRVGADKKQKQPIKPIKLVWQTTDGYTQSGGNNIDEMGMMKDLAKQSIVDLLSSMNADISDYSGDLTKANFTDLVGILGQSLLAGVISSPGHNLAGYNVTETVKSLGALYFADYFGLPKEIFKGADITNLENLKYLIGRSAIEKKLGLPFGTLDNLNLIATNQNGLSKPVYDLEGLLVNIGQRKVEHEMGLEAHDLDRYAQIMSTDTHQYVINNWSLGRIVIENDLNLPKNSWPTTATGFNDLKNYISDARVAILRIDPGYIDSILHLDPGTTKSFMSGPMTSEDYAQKVGLSRWNNTTAGLKYFALTNSAYQLPGLTTENPNAFDTWAEALKGNPEAFKTIGIYTLARLLGENSLDMDLTNILPAGASFQTAVISSSDGVSEQNVPFDRTTYGQFVFRDWLRGNLSTRLTAADGCGKPRPDNTAINVVYSGQTVYKGSADLKNPTKDDAANTVNAACPLYTDIKINSLAYSDATGQHNVTEADFPPGMFTAHELISEESARSAGLESTDLYSIMGFRKANGRSVFERIGAKMLYYGIANKAASPEEKAAIDLSNTNPSLIVTNSSNKTVVFYLSRIVTIQNLIPKIKGEWEAIADSSPEAKDITQRIKNITNAINLIKENNGLDLTKIHNIANVVSKVTPEIMAIKNNLKILKDRYSSQTGDEAVKKINQINALIYDVNAFILAASEIMAGHKIDSTDALTIDQLKQATNKKKDNRQNKKGLSDWQIMLLVFEMLSNNLSPEDLALRLGANTAEAKLDLPRNSILYLAQNFEKYGITGIDTFYDALGQAQIEQEFSMPIYYFQGNTVQSSIPKFDKNAGTTTEPNYQELIEWETTNGQSKIIPAYARYVLICGQSVACKSNILSENRWIESQRTLSGGKDFKVWVMSAQKNWLADPSHKTKYYDKTIDDVVANIKDRYHPGDLDTTNAKSDLLARMGFPATNNFNALADGSPVAWRLADSRAQAIDKTLKLPDGYTRMLFTRNTSITSKSVSKKDKNLIQASSLNISQQELEKYIQLVNGEVLPNEMAEFNGGAQTDYVINNPYADPGVTGPSCPITYTAKNGFMVNETTVPTDSFCYFDTKGRHCFESSEEASRYANDHPDDQIKDVLANMSGNIASSVGLTSSEDIAKVYAGMRNFITDKTAVTIFSDNILRALAQKPQENSPGTRYDELEDVTRISLTKRAFDGYDKKLTPALLNLFTRTSIDSPLSEYKIKVGTWVAQMVLTSNIFDHLGLNIDPTLFDGSDFYDILTGDFSALYRLGATFVDRAMDLKPGTTQLIIAAVSPEGRKCALNSAGGGLLGSAFGLTNFPLNKLNLNVDDFISTLGEEKIEETLSLPRGTFRVDGGGADASSDILSNLIKNVGVINFFVAFKLPLDLSGKTVAPTGDQTDRQYFNEAVQQILGTERYNSVKNASPQYQLAQVKTYLSASLVITSGSDVARENLERLLNTLLDDLSAKIASTDPNFTLIKPNPAGTDDSTANANADYNLQVKSFYDQMSYLDSRLGLDKFSTNLLLSRQTKPSKYLTAVGTALGVRVGETQLAQLLGLDQSESDAAVELATNIQKIFSCSANQGMSVHNGVCQTGSRPNTGALIGSPLVGVGLFATSNNKSDWYHRWDRLYADLDKVFHLKFDSRVGLPAGTIQQILDNPNNTFPILLDIGAKKLDAQNKLDSSRVFSFSGLYRALLPAESGAIQTSCHAETFPNGEDVILNNQIATAVAALRSKDGDKPAQAAALEALQNRADENAAVEQECVRSKKDALARDAGDTGISRVDYERYLGRVWEWAQQAAAEQIHTALYEFNIPGCQPGYRFNVYQSCNIGIDMPIVDIRAMMNGDLRYLSAVGMAMGANLAFVEIANIGTRNCNPNENSGCDQAVPISMRISYDEIKLALFGLPKDQLIPLVGWATETSGGYPVDPDFVVGASACRTAGGIWSGFNCMAQAGITNDAVASVNGQVNYQFGHTPANVTIETASVQSQIDTIRTDAVTSCANITDAQQNTVCVNNYYTAHNLDNLNHRLNLLGPNPNIDLSNNLYAREIQKAVKKAAQDKLKYDMMDIALWKLDENIFPGFSQIMVSGNTDQRWSALAKYVRNGVTNGHLFGINFHGLDPNLAQAAFGGATYLLAGNDPVRQKEALKSFGATEFNTLVSFISGHSEKWLGFKLNTEITSGLLVSVFTGDWGAGAFSLDGLIEGQHTTTKFLGSDRPNLGGTIVQFGLGKVFSWADKALGLKPGQGIQLFTATKNLYKAVKAWQAAKAATAGAKTMTESAALAGKEAASYQGMQQAAGALVQLAIEIAVDKLLGKTLGGIEDQLGLVPGTLAPLVSAAIYTGIVAAANAGLFGSAAVGFLPALGPWGLAALVAMFVLTNLLGVYKVEYWCSADGYFPGIGSPDPAKNDVSDIGIMGGKVGSNLNKTIQNLSIQAAQYKAKRLIGDTMEIQYNGDYNDSNGAPTIPTQIMTGRAEDVDYWKETVLNNVCKQRLGDGAQLLFNGQAAVCDAGMQRMGLWQNPQTIAWTHVGF